MAVHWVFYTVCIYIAHVQVCLCVCVCMHACVCLCVCVHVRGARFNRLRRLINCLPRIDSQSPGEMSNRLIAH